MDDSVPENFTPVSNMTLTKLKSALSTVREMLQDVRHFPGAMREFVEITRDRGLLVDEIAWLKLELESERETNAQILRELGWNKPEPPEPGRIRREMDGLFDELAVEKYVWRMQWDWAKERITELTAQLARYEAAETWHQVTAGEGELPPEGVDVIYRYDIGSQMFFSKDPPMYNDKYQWRFESSKGVPC